MSKNSPMTGSRSSKSLAGAGVVLATPFVVWFATRDVSSRSGPSYEFGPYQVGPESGFVIGGVAVLAALVSVIVLVIRTRQGVFDFQSWAVVVVTAVAAALGAAGWRVLTSGYSGADIGGPVVLLMDPLLIAGLVVGAVWIAAAGGRQTRRRTWLLTVAAVLVAPALFGTMEVLSRYDDSAGLITARQYADVQIGQTRSAVHDRLGREGSADFAVVDFPPVAHGLLCDYYDEVDANGARLPHAYQLCFRAGVLVSKDLSVAEPFAK